MWLMTVQSTNLEIICLVGTVVVLHGQVEWPRLYKP